MSTPTEYTMYLDIHITDNGRQPQNYWVFGLCPSSGILKIRKHNFSETGSVSVLRRGEETRILLS
jgi:hypothetical protein